MTYLIDAHHIGSRQTGNETIARNLTRELGARGTGGEELRYACSAAGRAEVAALSGTTPIVVGDSAVRRVAVDLPRIAKEIDAAALLVQYTKPRTRRPCVVMVHDLSPFDPMSAQWLSRRFRVRVRASIRQSARRASVLIALSDFTRAGLIDRFGLDPARVVIAPMAVDAALAGLIDGSVRARPPKAAPRVIAVGNVLPRKNLTLLAQAVAAARTAGAPVELRVVGGVPEGGRAIAAEIGERLGDAVSFTGYVTPEQLAQEYVDADALAFPSLFEGFGLPAIEAMYAGVPVLASDASSLTEVVSGAGVVLPPSDPSAWAAAIVEVTTEPGRHAELVALGRARAAAVTWDTAAAVVLGALEQAAGDLSTPRRGAA